MLFRSYLCSSLSKIMPQIGPQCEEYLHAMALKGECFSFQIAYKTDALGSLITIENASDLRDYTQIRGVELEPVEKMPPMMDEDVVGNTPGLYPDILEDLPLANKIPAVYNQWRSFWITVRIPKDLPAQTYHFKFQFLASEYNGTEEHRFETKTLTLQVINATLPAQTTKVTHWFHADCIAEYYHIPVFSEQHWKYIAGFMKNAVEHGMNMILTPLFTPPLDTAVGSERPTTQLVKISQKDGVFDFDFTQLTRWIDLARENGIRYFEFCHLFTQWGATCTPKIMVEVNGKLEKMFGWDVAADSQKYQDFLGSFLSSLKKYIERNQLQDWVYFHCSDEPCKEHLESYTFAANFMKKHLAGYKILDALSDVEFYKRGLVSIPVPPERTFNDFLEVDVPERWIYYCCGPITEYSNRFIYMTSSRNRALGLLLYKYQVEGFLHWGFNYYYSQYSRFAIDPYRTASSYGAFPSGDPFLVYPGQDGRVVDSIRHEIFHDALQDQRALQLLETKMPRTEIESMLNQFAHGGKTLELKSYPHGEENMLAAREKINKLILQFFG